MSCTLLRCPHTQPDHVILERRQAGYLLISVINLNLSLRAEVKAEGRREGAGGGEGLRGNCTPAAPLWCHSSVNRR